VLGFTWGVLGVEVDSRTPAAETAAASGRVVVRAVDPSGHPIGGASVRIMGTIGSPLATGKDGILEATLPEGAHTVVVSATGWTPVERTIVVQPGAEDDVTIVLFPEERVRVDPDTGQIFLRDKVFFEVDRAELRVDSLGTLDALAEVLLARNDLARIRIEGHTDATGTEEHNLELSQARAEAVMAYLVSQGVGADRLEAKGMGESRLLQQGDSEEVNATNRRVEFHVVD
jgi:outer membrane protein OmpA-like peptidoglycan-associated protein